MKPLRFVLLGDPVAHSKSPAMHAAAYRALGMPHVYEAVCVEEKELADWIARLRRGELAGINVTVPHKRAAMLLADDIESIAQRCDACNVLAFEGDRVVATNTDVPALVEELRDGNARGGTAIVIGNGGAARAAIAALEDLGAEKIIVRARRHADKKIAPSIIAEPFESTGSERNARWIVQATSSSAIADVIRFERAPNALALDVIYDRETEFLAAARECGLRTKNGLGMLARQGALAFERWLGVKAPFDVMLEAIS